MGWHWSDNDGIEVIHICHEDVLHVLEGPDGEGPSEVSVNRAGVGIGKGGEAEHFLKGTDLLGG